MKKVLFAILIFSVGVTGYAQDYKKEIEKEFLEYVNLLIDMEFEKSMNYILPDFFEIIPKSQMITLMEQSFNNPSIEIKLTNPIINKIDDSQKIEEKFYSFLTYSNQMNIKILGEEGESEVDKKDRINLTKASFENTFGKENVIYNEKTEFFEIKTEKNVYAISSNGETDWKFLTIEKNQKAILEKLLPKKLTEEL